MSITRVLVLAVAMAFAPTVGVSAEKPRFVSINLCTDLLLMALAEPGQIAALSPFSVDTRLSYMAEEARNHRRDASTAETVIAIDPDIVFAGRFTRRATREMLKRLGYRVVLLDPARGIAEAVTQIRQVAEIVGAPERGESLVEDINAALAEARAIAHPSPASAAIYQRRGYMTGGKTLSNELLAVTGFANAGAELAGTTGGFVTLEDLIADPPDFLVVSDGDMPAEDQGSALIAHPALAEIFPPRRRIILPERLTVCAGPSLPAAIRWLSQESARVRAP